MVEIAEKRREHKLTQAELAQLVGVSQRAIAAYELRDRMPSVRTAKRLGEVLEFPWADIFEEEDHDDEQRTD